MWKRKVNVTGEDKEGNPIDMNLDYVEGVKELKQYLEQQKGNDNPFECEHLVVVPQNFAYKHLLEPTIMKKGDVFCMSGISNVIEGIENPGTGFDKPDHNMYSPLYCSTKLITGRFDENGCLEAKCWRNEKAFTLEIKDMKDLEK